MNDVNSKIKIADKKYVFDVTSPLISSMSGTDQWVTVKYSIDTISKNMIYFKDNSIDPKIAKFLDVDFVSNAEYRKPLTGFMMSGKAKIWISQKQQTNCLFIKLYLL